MRSFVWLALIASLTGCGAADRFAVGVTGQPTKTCVDGVTYLQFTSGAAAHVDRAGKPVPCS